MRKLFAMLVIGLGLAVGFGFGNEVNACDCVGECTFAEEVRDEHIEGESCTEEHYECMECEGYFCDNLSCWCGEEVANMMSVEEFCEFEEAIWDRYLCEYCTNYCADCDSYYYKECMCDSCGSDCYECLYYDYELFIEDNYDMIMDIYEDVLEQIEEYRVAKEKEPYKLYEF